MTIRPLAVVESAPLAVLGARPRFPAGLPLAPPLIPDVRRVSRRLEQVLASGRLTNGEHVRALEERVAELCGVRHAVAVSSCTAGLMLVYRCLEVTGPVVIPSMTFAASPHALVWAGAEPRWADIEPATLNVDPADVARRLDGAAAISATHLYGTSCDVPALERLAAAAGIPLVLDAAHGLGARAYGRPLGGGGTAEVFSLSPTKVATGAEGGLVTTDDDDLAELLRLGRDYGNPGDYDCRFVGLNARMSELHAVVALASVEVLPDRLVRRRELVGLMDSLLEDVAGLRVVTSPEGEESTYKDLTLVVDADELGLDVPQLRTALEAEGIDSRRYFYPPCHRQRAYGGAPDAAPRADLPVTERLAPAVVSVPLAPRTTDTEIRAVAGVLADIAEHADRVRAALGQPARSASGGVRT
jgi:dTDP-4-amino-4,6-dideoxygalactose transaminase